VFLTGGDGLGWALDEELRLAALSMGDSVELTDLRDAEIVHSMWWRGLLPIPHRDLVGKRVFAFPASEIWRFLEAPESVEARRLVGRWVARSRKDTSQFASVGIESAYVPVLVDPETFRPLSHAAPAVEAMRARWNIPRDRYLIGSFQRDTEGADLTSPKLVKGPDLLFAMLHLLHARGLPIHAVLAGRRRFWIMRRLTEAGIPFTFLGAHVDGDDMRVNTLSREDLNVLYNLVDVYVVSSRSENGPQAVLEGAAAKCAVVSTLVGTAPDILEPMCLYRDPLEAADLIARDVETRVFAPTIETAYERIHRTHTPTAANRYFRELYGAIDRVPVCARRPDDSVFPPRRPSFARRVMRRLGLARPSPLPVVALWHAFRPPPWGGGNQFMLALQKALTRRGVRVLENTVGDADVSILQSIGFDVPRFRRRHGRAPYRVIHRIDGPFQLVRGLESDSKTDVELFALNEACATATVLQSAWSFRNTVALGHRPVNPVIIHNAADGDIFHRRGRVPFSRHRRVRLISTSWSDNVKKGHGMYRWLEDHLDWDRFEYTFVGRTQEEFRRIKVVPALPSEELADVLRQHDVYITASRPDACSNALIEALTCGLPALYVNDGGHPELVGYGGLPFSTSEELLVALERLVADYETFQSLVAPPTIDEIADRYLSLIHEVMRQ
jgi:glycosyltransferase involved in cell wall biosynthesis